MILSNFALVTNPQAVELDVSGQIYDLHNQGEFQGIYFDVVKRQVELNWSYFGDLNCLGTMTHKLSLRVFNVSFLSISPWDERKPFSEESCLFGVSRVVPQDDKVRFRNDWKPSDDFHLLFEFMSDQTIEVSGDQAVVEVADVSSKPGS